jgi:HTH-type transcriptional regulator/antitoxin HigA
MTTLASDITDHWAAVGPVLTIHDEREYDQAVVFLNSLLDEVGTDESHPLYTLLDTLGTVMHAYGEEHHPMPDATGVEVLAYLIEEHGLTQSDLPEVGSQGVVSETLNGKRELNVRQIRALSQRFSVSPAAFV